MTPLDTILARLPDARKSGTGYRVACPLRGDNPTSLLITESETGVVGLHCFARQCDSDAILRALGLSWQDRYPDGDPRRQARGKGRKEAEKRYRQKLSPQQQEAERIILSMAADQTYKLLFGPAPSPLDPEALGSYAGVIEALWDVYTQQGTHEAVRDFFVNLIPELQLSAAKYFTAVNRRCKDGQGKLLVNGDESEENPWAKIITVPELLAKPDPVFEGLAKDLIAPSCKEEPLPTST